ncbi:MAG: biotin/lipoyl-binding protein [Anaerolineae bacterium]|nr:biotin/lipoyl-binding protein [Anaerolineae bacterium]
MKYITTINDKKFEIEIRNDGSVWVNGESRDVDFLALNNSLYSIIMENRSHEVVVEERDGAYEVLVSGRLYNGTVLDERSQLMRSRRGGLEADSGEISIKAPMPGLIVAIPVSEGQEVKSGQTLLILESMKMQNEIKAPRDGTVHRISVQQGETVEQKRVMVTLI